MHSSKNKDGLVRAAFESPIKTAIYRIHVQALRY